MEYLATFVYFICINLSKDKVITFIKFQLIEYACMYTVYVIKKNIYNRSTIVTTAQKYHSRQNYIEFNLFAKKHRLHVWIQNTLKHENL